MNGMSDVKIKISFLATVCCLAFLPNVSAQNFDEVLSVVESSNKTLLALKASVEAEVKDAFSSVGLDNPEIETGYLWGRPSENGGRFDFSVMQPFDFPTVYYWKRKVAGGQASLARMEYEVKRREVLLEAQTVCIDIVYHNARSRQLQRRLDNAKAVEAVWASKDSLGNSSALDLDRARLCLLDARRDYDENEVEREALVEQLHHLSGHVETPRVDAADFLFEPLPADFDEWISEIKSPEVECFSIAYETASAEVRLRRNECLPSFKAGYMSEHTPGVTLSGVGVGISIPLWKGWGRIKASGAARAAAELSAEEALAHFHCEMEVTYSKALRLQSLMEDYRKSISGLDPVERLGKLLSSGEISLESYLTRLEAWYDSLDRILESEREFGMLLAQLHQFD